MVARPRARRRRGRCSRCSWHDRRLHTEEKRYTRQARCRRASSYEKLAPPPPPTAPKTRSSAGLSSPSLSLNLSLRPLALVLCHRSTPSLRAFAIRGGVLLSAEWSRSHPLFLSFPLVFSFSLLFSFFLSAPMQGSLSFFVWDRERVLKIFLDFSFDTLSCVSCEESPGLRPVRRDPLDKSSPEK